MMDLFSSFDPTSSKNLSINWMMLMIAIIAIPSTYWITPSRMTHSWNKMITMFNHKFKTTHNNSPNVLLMSLFSLILLANLTSLFPYIFPITSNLSINLSMALPLWLSLTLYGWYNNTKLMFSHMTPMSTPMILSPLMVCIETISNLIRPMTLTIRLTANLTTGHLLMILINNSISNGPLIVKFTIIVQMILLGLELGISVIQAYIFTMLITLYSKEIN